MMHSSSSVGAGPYDPGGASEDHNTPDDASPSPSSMRQNQHDINMHEGESSDASDLKNKQKPEVSRNHRRPRLQHPSEEDLAQPRRTPDNGVSGWCDLTVEYDRTGDTAAELDDFSFAPAGTAAIVASNNHEIVQGKDNDDNSDEEEEGENDYVWGPQHLFLSRHKSVHNNKSQSQRNAYSISGYGHGAYEAASAAAASARSSGRQLMGSLYSHLPSYPEHGGGGELEASARSLDDDVAAVEEESVGIIENEWPYELAPPATVSMSRGYSNGSDGGSSVQDIMSSSVHTETYIFGDDNQNMLIPSDNNGSMPSNLFPTSEDDNTFYATANAETKNGGEENELTGISLVDDGGYQDSVSNCDVTGNKELSHSPQIRPVFSTQDSEHDDDDYFYNADEPTSTLRSEVVEVLQEDFCRVSAAFFDTIHKTSALVEPIAAVARRQSTSSSPVRQRLSVLSQSALGITRSMSERASNTVAVTIPTRQSLREKSGRLWNKTQEAEEIILYAAQKAEKSAIISSAGKAMSHIHVPVPSMKMPEAISDALESVETAAEELRVNDVDVQSGIDDAELLSQLTAGAYA